MLIQRPIKVHQLIIKINYLTSITQLCEPTELGTQEVQQGSFNQFPSTTNLYSYLPGLSVTLADQLPLLSFLASNFFVLHLLKQPATTTAWAAGEYNLNTMGFVPTVRVPVVRVPAVRGIFPPLFVNLLLHSNNTNAFFIR